MRAGTIALLLTLAALWSQTAMAKDNAGIFFYGTPPAVAHIAALAEGAKVTTARARNKSRVTLKWPDVVVTVNIDPDWDREVQLAGMRGWIGSFPESGRTAQAVVSFLADLDKTTTSYGTVISPRYDGGGKAARFLMRLLEGSGGFLFTHQSFYTAKGMRIIGAGGDPDRLIAP